VEQITSFAANAVQGLDKLWANKTSKFVVVIIIIIIIVIYMT